MALVWIFGWILAVSCICMGPAHAQGIESVISPGKMSRPHARYEGDCAQCHVRFDRKGQDRLCMDCHKEVGADFRAHTGYHGRVPVQACKSCHTEHKGLDARIVELDPRKFDHKLTDYALRGKHADIACDKCHVAGRKYREAPQECVDCHRKDDVHKGSLGAKCADCHTENRWKEAKFDHDKTRFPLKDKHVDVKCADCHLNNQYKDTPRDCYSCHRKDDNSKGHKGQFGEKCESCHNAKLWKNSFFNHDTDTRYTLRGKHRTTTCADCHKGNIYKVKLSQDCNSCHQKDDKHKGTLGDRCASCHTENNWKEPARFDHNKTDFPLRGKHQKTDCKDCHTTLDYRQAPKDCIACHQKDDKHEKTLGTACASCHGESTWKDTSGRFDHDKTHFALRNGHADAKVKCAACHADLRSFRPTPLDCYSCHRKDDKHEGQEGTKCGDCHTDRTWKDTRFNHTQSRFPLTGKHILTDCSKCHSTPRYRDASRDCYSCHKADDHHKLTLGVQCESCHNTRVWSLWSFDHDRQTKYRLTGAHAKVTCEECHRSPAPAGKPTAGLGTNCVACHRKDDFHDGQYGMVCEQCHVTDNWKSIRTRIGRARVGHAPWSALSESAPPPLRRPS